jgi:hypothetical protein
MSFSNHDTDFTNSIMQARSRYHEFIFKCLSPSKGFFLTTKDSSESPYALCFAIFGLQLLNDKSTLKANKSNWSLLLRANVNEFKAKRLSLSINLNTDKPYLQLLTFTLSSLFILDSLEDDPLKDHVLPLIDQDIFEILNSKGVFKGDAQSGNFSMFYAILLEHSKLFLQIDTELIIKKWIQVHLNHINKQGFWGNSSNMTYLQFQNGYHQYEIFNYFNVKNKFLDIAAQNVANLADINGQFAPYYGGGGCFDYDAIFIISAGSKKIINHNYDLLIKTLNTLLTIQSNDGGFSESKNIRPRNLDNIFLAFKHVVSSHNSLSFIESLKYNLALLRSKHNKRTDHWSDNSRDWSESNLWDSWFRMLTIARIDLSLELTHNSWGFITYPGIGFDSNQNY